MTPTSPASNSRPASRPAGPAATSASGTLATTSTAAFAPRPAGRARRRATNCSPPSADPTLARYPGAHEVVAVAPVRDVQHLGHADAAPRAVQVEVRRLLRRWRGRPGGAPPGGRR